MNASKSKSWSLTFGSTWTERWAFNLFLLHVDEGQFDIRFFDFSEDGKESALFGFGIFQCPLHGLEITWEVLWLGLIYG